MDPILESPVDVGEPGVVIEEAPSGLPIIALPSALTGLHYFDGQAMRDARLTAEQNYRRALAALAARAGGFGIESGLNVTALTADAVRITAGLAVDGLGRVLELPAAQTISMSALIESSRAVPLAMEETAFTSAEFLRCIRLWTKRAPSARAPVLSWIVTASWTEAAALASAKAGTVTREGIRLRAMPLALHTPLARSRSVALDARAHLRSLSASALFADEWTNAGNLISGDGLSRGAWCLGAALDDRREVPLAVVAMAGDEILFVDEWMVRRERHEPPPARYWAGLMRMRPWSAFLAQVLQFQCQLSDAGVSGGALPRTTCDDTRDAITGAATYLSNVYALWRPARALLAESITPQQRDESDILIQSGGATRLSSLTRDILTAANAIQRTPIDRQLIRHGIVELPPAGFLPVSVGKAPTVNDQVRALVGEGVDLRFCIVDPDLIPAELERAQHMERISLLTGIDDPARMPRVDVFVPDGIAVDAPVPTGLYQASARIATTSLGAGLFGGAARREPLPNGGAALHAAMSSVVARMVELLTQPTDASGVPAAAASTTPTDDALWLTVRTDRAIQNLHITEVAHIGGRAILASSASPAGAQPSGRELTFDGQLTIRSTADSAPDAHAATASVVGTFAVVQHRTTDAEELSVITSRRVSLGVDIRWSGDATRGTMLAKISLVPSAVALSALTSASRTAAQQIATVEKQWDDASGKPPRTSVAILVSSAIDGLLGAATASDGAEQFIVLELIENADVARDTPPQPQHVLANSAIRNVTALLAAEQTFTRDALTALFPPVAPPKLLVQATRDYVLFRRRRDERYVPWRDPVTAGIRRFRLLNITVANPDEAVRLIRALRAPDATLTGTQRESATKAKAAAPVFIEFSSESAAPTNDPAELRADLAAVGAGPTIAGAIIALERDDGPTILTRRLHALIPLLAPIAILGDAAPTIALPETPADLATIDADGVILLVTTSP